MVVLRDESGAAISAGEILRQMNQYIMFDDLNEDTMVEQRLARSRKAKSLMTGQPDYIKKDRSDNLGYLENFDGRLKPYSVPTPQALEYLINNPDRETIKFFVKRYGKDALPEGLEYE